MNVLQPPNQKYIEGFEDWHGWIGKRVCVSGNKPGILKYFGQTEFADGIWCGVELNEPVGKNNGSVKGVQYFQCKDNHGIFVSLNKVEKVCGEITWDRNFDGQKKLNRRFTLHSGAPPGKSSSVSSNEERLLPQGDKRRKTTFFNFPNDNVNRMSISSRSQKPQLNSSYVISVESKLTKDSDDDDILNKTVILSEDSGLNCDGQRSISSNRIYAENNSLLNTFDLGHIQAPEVANNNNNNRETALDGTFVLDEQHLKDSQEKLGNHISEPCNFTLGETDESLCILSLSQMKDFTICTEQFLSDSQGKLKNFLDSCDNANSNVQLNVENKPIREMLPSGVFQTDVKLCQKSSTIKDSVFLRAEVANDNMHITGPKRNSRDFLMCRHSDEMKDICFQPTHVQSSTPSDETKSAFQKKMLLRKSFQLDDSFKLEAKCPSSSTLNKPLSDLELLVEPNELISKVDLPIQPTDNYLENENLSLLHDEVLTNAILDVTELIDTKQSNQRKSAPSGRHVSDLVLHPIEADDIPLSISGETPNVMKLLGEMSPNLDDREKSKIVCLSTMTKNSSDRLENANLNITQDLCSASSVNGSTVTEICTVPSENVVQDTKHLEDSTVPADRILPVSEVRSKLGSVREMSSFIVERDTDGHKISKSIDKTSSEEMVSDPQHSISDAAENGVLHQTFNCNSSYTLPQNGSYIVSIKEPSKQEGSATYGEIATNLESGVLEPSSVILNHSMPSNESFTPAENVAASGQKAEYLLNVTQNLNATICISDNLNSHNMTFYVAEDSETDASKKNMNTTIDLSRQSVGPVSQKNNVHNSKTSLATTTSRTAPVANGAKPCVPNSRDKIAPNRYADSVKQNANVQSQKQVNRRYSAAPRVNNPQENRTQTRTQAISKIDTNLKMSRQSLPRQFRSPLNTMKKQPEPDNSVFKVPETKTIKNVLNYQRIRQDARKENDLDGSQRYPPGKRKSTVSPGSENKSSILKENTQTVNVPMQNFDQDPKNDGLISMPLSRRSSTQSISSQSSSKIAVFNKKSVDKKDSNPKNGLKVDAPTRRQTVGNSPSNQKFNAPSRYSMINQSSISPGIREKQNQALKKTEGPRVPVRLSESVSTKKSVPRRVFIPSKLKPVQEC